ncbi:MAG: hypothetical protein K8J08_00115 [Thermoanaerobaculia bacterium]|nr:hypothetical protein [Thermoanaerobaculia bacterium]
MFDITKSQQIIYNDRQGIEQSVTVYGDHEAARTYFMVPVPRLVHEDGNPVFSLVKYKSNEGGISGVCTFDVEVTIPDDARQAAERALGGDIVWGQFDWIGGDCSFIYEVDGEEDLIVVSPSLYGNNRASFQVPLRSDNAVESFVNAFSGDGAQSSYRIRYDLQVLTQLLGARATVKYNADSAITFEKRYETKKDTWGRKKQVLAEVKTILQTTDAGEVHVTEGRGSTPELIQRVRDWAWTALERAVADAVSMAIAAGNTGNPVSATSSFERTFSEDSIVDWETPIVRSLQKFDQQTWQKVYTEVDNRELVLTFGLRGRVTAVDGAQPVERVTVTVEYPTRTTDNSFDLIPGNDQASSMTYVAPGSRLNGVFDPRYKYKYQVFFSDDSPPYNSDWINDSDTEISILPNQLGIQQVDFVGFDIPFTDSNLGDGANTVASVFVDFYFDPPAGLPPRVQTQEINGNGPERKATFDSYYKLPLVNRFVYRLRYQMSNGQTETFYPTEDFGTQNQNVVPILDPFEVLTFNLRSLVTASAPTFDLIDLTAIYQDQANSTKKDSNSWSWTPTSGTGIESATAWSFRALTNPEAAFFELNGEVILSDGSFAVNELKVQAKSPRLILRSTAEPFSVSIMTQRIDWTVVEQVAVNIFQLETSSFEKTALGGHGRFLRQLPLLSGRERIEVEGKRINYRALSLLEEVDGEPIVERYYDLQRPRESPNVVFYYNASYIHKDGTMRTLGQTEVTDQLQLILPPDGDSDEPPVPLRAEIRIDSKVGS